MPRGIRNLPYHLQSQPRSGKTRKQAGLYGYRGDDCGELYGELVLWVLVFDRAA